MGPYEPGCAQNGNRVFQDKRGLNPKEVKLKTLNTNIKKYIGACFAVLGRVDAVVFTGGIGENATPIRKQCCQGLEGLGITVDERKNEKAYEEVLEIQRNGAPVKILAVRTNEEREIAEQTVAVLMQTRGSRGKTP